MTVVELAAWGASVVVWLCAVVVFVLARRIRQRRLRPSMVVLVDGNPHFLHAVPAALNDVEGWGLEPLGELLARVVVIQPNMTLFEVLARAGWKPPPADDRPLAR